jgi:metal-responsive CopG/Arc/MetJ family transcriptional regulator
MVPFSVSIRKSEAEEFLKTIEKTGFTRAEIGRYAINYFIKQYNNGKIELQKVKVETETLQAP